jgi:acetyl-CoA acetyltransferase family protein
LTVWVVDAVRTPIGRHGGGLSGVRPDDLAAHVLRPLVARTPALDPESIDDIWLGAANGAGEDNRDVARMALLLAGLPVSTPGVTVNRLCGSGMEAVIGASRAVATGDASVEVAGGVESMTRAPWVLLKPEHGFPRGDTTLHSTTLGWRMVNPAMPAQWTVALGEGAELLAELDGITRDEQDEFAAASHHKAAAAWGAGWFDAEVETVEGTDLPRDESVRPETSVAQLAKLPPVFRSAGTVTAGNSSPLNDGAAALLLADDGWLVASGAMPMARIAGRGVSAVEPQWFGIGPVAAAESALRRAGIGWSDLDAVELNEAFAAQALACLNRWPELDRRLVNPCGGAIAIGHPLGCSGARLLTTLVWHLRRSGGRYGLAALCVGVGQGVAVVIEAV